MKRSGLTAIYRSTIIRIETLPPMRQLCSDIFTMRGNISRTTLRKEKQAAERVKKQAEAENALQQARAKRARAKQRAGDVNVKIAKILGSFGCAIVVMLTIILVIPAIQDSCGTADKPVERSIEPPDWDDIFIDKSVESSKTYIDRGKAKADKGEYFEAISDYDMAIQLEPANAKSYHYRGEAKEN